MIRILVILSCLIVGACASAEPCTTNLDKVSEALIKAWQERDGRR